VPVGTLPSGGRTFGASAPSSTYDRRRGIVGRAGRDRHCYPEPSWLAEEGGWIKDLLLILDEIALLRPEHMHGRHIVAAPSLAEPLADRSLLRVLRPETFVDDETATTQSTDVMEALLEGGVFDDLSDPGGLAELSMSRMGCSRRR